MGPIVLFDKSFLQSLTVDESVWFDNFFIPNICPLFYIETLADLEKSVKDGRTPEKVVGSIADKFPEMSGSPCAFHVDLSIANLLGYEIKMVGRIPMYGGRSVEDEGESGIVFGLTPEAEAFSRWQKREFLEIERSLAKTWRKLLTSLDLNKMAKRFEAIGISGKSCKTLENAKVIAENVVSSQEMQFERIRLCFLFLGVPKNIQRHIFRRWISAGYPPLTEFAPYAAYVMEVEVFFQVAMASSLISSQRASNRIDIGYLFYLPFSQVFISADKLHKRCAPLFLRHDQEFVWGTDLKADLAKLNRTYSDLPDSTKEKGVMSFAAEPPMEGEFLITRLWDRHLTNWREKKQIPKEAIEDSRLVAEINKKTKLGNLEAKREADMSKDADWMIIQRSVHKKKGSWWQVPKDLEDSKTR